MIVVLGVLFVGATAVMQLHEPRDMFERVVLPGTLFLDSPGWRTPSGEYGAGAFEYVPATGAVTNLLPPTGFFIAPGSGALNHRGDAVVAYRIDPPQGVSLFSVERATQEPTLIARAPFSSEVPVPFSAVVSTHGDMRGVAYALMNASGEKEIYLAGSNLPQPILVGEGEPVLFSPDNRVLAVEHREELLFVRLDQEETLAVRGIEGGGTRPFIFIGSPRGTHVAVSDGTQTSLYRLVWDTAEAIPIGSVETSGEPVFSAASNSVAFFEMQEEPIARIFTLENDSLLEIMRASVPFAPPTRVIQWSW